MQIILNIEEKNLKEKEDFFILEKNEWEFIKEIFSCQFEIKRYRNPQENQIELYPIEVNKKIKIFKFNLNFF